MSPYLYILVKHFMVILVLILLFKYTNVFSILPPIIFLIAMSILIDVVFYNIDTSSTSIIIDNDKKELVEENKKIYISENFDNDVNKKPVPPDVNKEPVPPDVNKEPVPPVDIYRKTIDIRPTSLIKSIEPQKLSSPDPNNLTKYDEMLFNNYNTDYYEKGTENIKDKSDYVNDQLNMYDTYLKNSFKASLG